MQFPYGLADFHALRTAGYFYVDRTDRIPRVEQTGRQLLFLRPRRFGKSLWLSTLENYYDVAKAEDFDRLFGGLAVGRAPTPERNRYLVLRWDFSTVLAQGDAAAIARALHQHINGEIEAMTARYAAWLPRAVTINPDNAIASFRSLLSVASLTPYPVYLFIDEYDNFANEVLVSRGRHPDRDAARYEELVSGEGVVKTVFKAVKAAAQGRGLERVFITGVSPVVMSDISSGYNVAENLSLLPEFNDLCGFREGEVRAALEAVAQGCGFDVERTEEALGLMRTFYNGYGFTPEDDPVPGQRVYNPTLALYFLKRLAGGCRYPGQMLDDNLAMDRNRIRYVAGLPHGATLATQALDAERPITVAELSNRFGVEEMLSAPKDHGFLASLLYYFGVLTLAGRDERGELRLTVPNLVVRRLYVERIVEALLPDYEDMEQRREAAARFHGEGELEPLCDFIERRFFPLFDNRDLRWTNELVVKTAFLTLLYHDAAYIMDSETAVERGYADLTLILRPDMRRYALLDHVLEFKYLPCTDLGLSGAEVQTLPREELRARPAVVAALAAAEGQLAKYRAALERAYGAKLKLRCHAVVCVGCIFRPIVTTDSVSS